MRSHRQWSKFGREGGAVAGLLNRILSALLLVAIAPAAFAQQETDPNDAKRVLVVMNRASTASVQVGTYYRSKRNIPRENMLFIDVSRTEEISNGEYTSGIETPVRDAIKKLEHQIDFIVLTKDVPIRVRQGKYSVDALLAVMDLPLKPIDIKVNSTLQDSISPYFKKNEPFSSKKFGFYLVTRLDGYTLADAKQLVDNSLAAKPDKGPYFFDEAGNRNSSGYVDMQRTLSRANTMLLGKGFDSTLDKTATFIAPDLPLMGYASWGSNDGKFNLAAYKKIKFKPGAICETFVSTSGRTFKKVTGGQSLITDLIASGVTGVKGYVSEPFTFALAKPDILFDLYTSGRNLAESFYGASQILRWKDIVIGDPLCNPYKKN